MNRRTRPETRTAMLRPASNTMRPGNSTAFHAPALRPDGSTAASENYASTGAADKRLAAVGPPAALVSHPRVLTEEMREGTKHEQADQE